MYHEVPHTVKDEWAGKWRRVTTWGGMLSENLNQASSYIFSFWILSYTLAGNWYWGGMLSENLNWASGS